MADSLQSIIEKFAALSELRSSTMERVQTIKGNNGYQFDLAKKVPHVERSLAEIDARVMALCEMAPKSETDVESASILIPQPLIDGVIKPLDQLNAQYQSIAETLSGIETNGGPGNLDPAVLTLQSANSHVNLQLGSVFQQIWNHSDAVLIAYYPLLNLIGGKGFLDFSAAVEAFSTAMEQVHRERAELEELSRAAQADRNKVEELQAQSTPLRDEIDRLKTESANDRKTLSEYANEGTTSIAGIRGTTEQAEQLKVQVDSYKATFENFQKQLDAREEALKKGNKAHDELVEKLRNIEAATKTLTDQAEAMLTGATVAGLAGSFGELRNKISDELKSARRVFYGAIVLLFLSVIPLVAYVVPGLASLLGLEAVAATNLSGEAGTLEFFGQIIVRALLLLPAAWFAKFAATRHAILFRLQEHYAYKYSVAASVDGFKKQAEPFKDGIAAATFFELTYNPADRMESKSHEERHPNRAMDWVMEKLGATYDSK